MQLAPEPALAPHSGRAARPPRNDRWATLADDVAEPNAFYMPELLWPALRHLARGDAVRVIEAVEGSDLIGLLPVVVRKSCGRMPVTHVANWMHPHCFFGAPLLRKGREEQGWAALLAQIDDAPWATGFLHLSGLDPEGATTAALISLCRSQGRQLLELQRYERALLHSALDADSYWEANVRAKKRKELRRLQKRLAEIGKVKCRILTEAAEVPRWCADFLHLEAAGWKGEQGTALAASADDAAFFRASITAALASDRLLFVRLEVDGQPIAMLVNFLHGVGGFSFKIAFDENMARFSPGVLIEIENLRLVQADPAIAWMDSCAAADHPMIDSLWAERRAIAQYRVALKGSGLAALRRRVSLATVNSIETVAKTIRNRGS